MLITKCQWNHSYALINYSYLGERIVFLMDLSKNAYSEKNQG